MSPGSEPCISDTDGRTDEKTSQAQLLHQEEDLCEFRLFMRLWTLCPVLGWASFMTPHIRCEGRYSMHVRIFETVRGLVVG